MKGLIVALQRSGRTEEAESVRAQHFGGSPDSPALARAQSLRAAGDLRGAHDLCQELLEREPENIAALKLLAFIAMDDERYGETENLLRRIVSLAPGSGSAAHDLARFLGDRGRYPEGIELLEQVSSTDNGLCGCSANTR